MGTLSRPTPSKTTSRIDTGAGGLKGPTSMKKEDSKAPSSAASTPLKK